MFLQIGAFKLHLHLGISSPNYILLIFTTYHIACVISIVPYLAKNGGTQNTPFGSHEKCLHFSTANGPHTYSVCNSLTDGQKWRWRVKCFIWTNSELVFLKYLVRRWENCDCNIYPPLNIHQKKNNLFCSFQNVARHGWRQSFTNRLHSILDLDVGFSTWQDNYLIDLVRNEDYLSTYLKSDNANK
jgi:hypothetical protein